MATLFMQKQSQFRHFVLIMTLIVLAWNLSSARALLISEVMYHPLDETLEFIELYNPRAVFEDLSGFAFTNGIQYEFPPGTVLEAKEYLVVALDPNALAAAYDITNVYGPFTGRLSNGGEDIDLSNANGEIVLSLGYNDDHPWPVIPDGTGHSLVLSRPGADPQEGSTWSASAFIGGTPGAADAVQVESEDPTLVTLIDIGHTGRYFKGTAEPAPGAGGEPTTAWTQIEFEDTPRTGWLQGPSGYGYSDDPAEQQFIRTTLDDMPGNYLSVYVRLAFTLTAEEISSFAQLLAEVHYDDDYVLYLNGTRVADSGVLPGDPPAFDQGRGQGTDPGADTVDLSNRMNLLMAGTNVLAIQVHNASLSGSSDCIAGPILRAVVAEPGTGDNPNARILINEVLANSDAGAGTDWIELYNPGPGAVSLDNVYLSDDPGDLLKYKIPHGIQLQPGEFWAVSEGPAPEEIPFALDASGETVYVTAASADTVPVPLRVLDAVRFGNMPPDTVFGRFPDGSAYLKLLEAPTQGGPNARGLTHDIVINEIMYHHGTRDERYEYIELYNRGTETISLEGWAFVDGIDYIFPDGSQITPDGYVVVAQDPNLLESLYNNLVIGVNLFGPYTGRLNDHSERVRLSYPLTEVDPVTQQSEVRLIVADEVTYYDGGRWPVWADGRGTSLELRDPQSDNDTPDAWAASDESGKSDWQSFSYTIQSNDPINYTRDQVNIFDMMLLNQGEILLDDVQLRIGGVNRLTNGNFESGTDDWRILGNHVQSFVTSTDVHSGSRALHLIATGHGDPGANRINQSINANTRNLSVTFQGWAKWLRGSPYLLLRTSRQQNPVQPPRPAHAFALDMPLNQGTPGTRNTAMVANRGPDILEVQHQPVLPAAGEPVVVSARVLDIDGVAGVVLSYRSEGSGAFTPIPMLDDGSGNDAVAGDGLYTAAIPGAAGGTMRAFYIQAADNDAAANRFPSMLNPTADVPERTCLVRIGDTLVNTEFATYRIWMSNDVLNTFRSRPNLSNELMDCTFVYNNTEVFYNAGIRFRGSPFLRSGAGRDPRGRYAFRIEFNPDQRFGTRDEINLDNTEGGNRGPLQERASYWFYRHMGLQYSTQEFIRPIINGNSHGNYEDVQKIDGDYIDAWFPEDADGYIHKIDDYFEYSADGTGFANLDEGLKYDGRHPLIPETYRWGFEKRAHRQNDTWDHLFDFAVAMNTSSDSPSYEQTIESVIHPEHFARVLALRHAVGDWDSYGYNRGKNNYFYYAPQEQKWYLLPWDIDFTLGSGDGPNTNLFSVNSGQFPEVRQFLDYPKYREMYLQAFSELISGPWKTSYGTNNPPTAFDRFLDDAADALIADGMGSGRRDGIKQFVRDRRNYMLTQVPVIEFKITTNNGEALLTTEQSIEIAGVAPSGVVGIALNETPVPITFTSRYVFELEMAVPLSEGVNYLTLQGLNAAGQPVPGAIDTLIVVRLTPCTVTSIEPTTAPNTGPVTLTIRGSDFTPGSDTSVTLTKGSTETGFDALYVQSTQAFDHIDAASLLLNDPTGGVGDEVLAVHEWINFSNPPGQGEFPAQELSFAPPFDTDGTNYAVRFSGFIHTPSPGLRYFGVNSDDGFSLRIDDVLVGEFAGARAPATTDVIQTGTAGTMTFQFPQAGSYPLVLDFYENGGGEAVEFFQTNATGGDRRLINVDAELPVTRADIMTLEATNVEVVDEQTITCQIDLTGAEPGDWNLIVTPPPGLTAECEVENAFEILGP